VAVCVGLVGPYDELAPLVEFRGVGKYFGKVPEQIMVTEDVLDEVSVRVADDNKLAAQSVKLLYAFGHASGQRQGIELPVDLALADVFAVVEAEDLMVVPDLAVPDTHDAHVLGHRCGIVKLLDLQVAVGVDECVVKVKCK